MLVRNFNLKKLCQNRVVQVFKSFSTQDDNNEEEKIFVAQQQIDYEKERRFLRDGKISLYLAKEKEALRLAQEEARKRYEEIKKGNKMFLLNHKVPGVESKVNEKY